MVKLKSWWKYAKEWCLLFFGAYDRFAHFSGNAPPQRVIFLCKGNVCRSVYAERYLQECLRREGGTLEVISCGLDTDGGIPANSVGIKVARERGIDLEGHSSKKLQELELSPTDLLVVMEPYMITALPPGHGASVIILGMVGKECRPSIADPYGEPEDAFRSVFSIIESKVDVLRLRLMP
ncbi:hypothetical protein CLH62_01820 [Marinobacter guineae]|uniref:protein-tyrosine-phosphatase n=1 Tax=Marinobacter guineae TaxID=432303 RepID=A0A2G1VHU4_9GAMM|nr:hypothetical protein [Marinobacter guineae]PHQ26361.1 hypothetical protein CLH62_01820 [Marinobacter guineae]